MTGGIRQAEIALWEAPTLARCIAGVEVAFARVRALVTEHLR